jgi:hypothetical protein
MEIVRLNYDTRLDVLNIAVTYNIPVHTFVEGVFLQKLAQCRAVYKFIASLYMYMYIGSNSILVCNLFRTLH